MDFSSAYLLVSHGSRDPRPQIALEHLAQSVANRLLKQQGRQASNAREWATRKMYAAVEAPPAIEAGTTEQYGGSSRWMPLVGTAVLELAPLPLHEQIRQFAEQAIVAGYETVKIVPLFLLAGVHVMEDIPAEIAIARQALNHAIKFDLRPHLGSHPNLWKLLINPVDAFAAAPQTGKILIAHGSRRPDSHQLVEAIAARLGAVPAYWSVAPSLEDQVTVLVKHGHQQIAILPYFLFEGGITDAIRQTVEQLNQRFPYARLHLSQPLGATPELADCVLDLIL